MKPIRLLLLSALGAFVLNGCAHHVGPHSAHVGSHTEPEYAQPGAVPCFGTSALRYTVYYGSDEKWHYFESHRDLRLERYKVPRHALEWSPTFAVGRGRLYVERDREGTLRPIMPAAR